jgi:hypothetical protein
VSPAAGIDWKARQRRSGAESSDRTGADDDDDAAPGGQQLYLSCATVALPAMEVRHTVYLGISYYGNRLSFRFIDCRPPACQVWTGHATPRHRCHGGSLFVVSRLVGRSTLCRCLLYRRSYPAACRQTGHLTIGQGHPAMMIPLPFHALPRRCRYTPGLRLPWWDKIPLTLEWPGAGNVHIWFAPPTCPRPQYICRARRSSASATAGRSLFGVESIHLL